MTRALIITGLLVALLSPTAPCAAQEAPAPGWFLPFGVNLGTAITLDEGSASFLLGGELSAAYLFGTSWIGVYGDGVYDFGVETGRASAGLEAGWFILGFELGYLAEFDAALRGQGLRLGGVLGPSFFAAYLRWDHLFRETRSDSLELGVLMKWPFALNL